MEEGKQVEGESQQEKLLWMGSSSVLGSDCILKLAPKHSVCSLGAPLDLTASA